MGARWDAMREMLAAKLVVKPVEAHPLPYQREAPQRGEGREADAFLEVNLEHRRLQKAQLSLQLMFPRLLSSLTKNTYVITLVTQATTRNTTANQINGLRRNYNIN